jgi:predicted ATP-dependent protease
LDIEREAKLGQAIHTKGVMILSGYLGHKYAQDFPLAITANLAMEQSYGYIDGDSASLGELCCLISALINQPLKQTFAITGSINQYGEVQAIGGVNEKIEGFFRLCKARGLNGEHGVIIPFANIRNLALKKEVVDAVEAGTFFIYGINKVDEALLLLMDRAVGEPCDEHYFSKDSINFEVINRLKQIADVAGNKDEDK